MNTFRATATEIISLSSCHARARFFVMGKNYRNAPPCIDSDSDFMVKNHYPLLLILSAFELIRKAQIFTKLNLYNASHLVRIQVGEERKTAYNTPRGDYEYLVMSFGLTREPTLFQDLVRDIRDMLNIFVSVYLDDHVTFSQSEREHIVQVCLVLGRLLQHQLYVKVKCEFHQKMVPFLGYVISLEQIKMNPEKVNAGMNWQLQYCPELQPNCCSMQVDTSDVGWEHSSSSAFGKITKSSHAQAQIYVHTGGWDTFIKEQNIGV